MKYLILGASGNVGRLVLKSLLEKAHEVTAFVRDPGRLQDIMDKNLFVVKGDATNSEDLRPYVSNSDVVINCVGPRNVEDSKNLLSTKVTQAILPLNPKLYISITKSFLTVDTDSKRTFADNIYTKNYIKKVPEECEDRQVEMNTLLHSPNKNWILIRVKEIQLSGAGNIHVSNHDFKGAGAKSAPLGNWLADYDRLQKFAGQVVFAWSDK